jgi:hypothetical protein
MIMEQAREGSRSSGSTASARLLAPSRLSTRAWKGTVKEGTERFQFRFTGIGRLVSRADGTGPWAPWIDVSPTTVDVHMGWVFHAAIPGSV